MAEFDEATKQALGEQDRGAARSSITEADISADRRLYTRAQKLAQRAIQPETVPSYFPPAPQEPLFKPGKNGVPTFNQRVTQDVDLSWVTEAHNTVLAQEAERIERDFYALRGRQQLEYVASLDPVDLALVDNEDIDYLHAAADYDRLLVERQNDTSLEDDIDKRLAARERLQTGIGLIFKQLTGTSDLEQGAGLIFNKLTGQELVANEVDREAIRAEIVAEMDNPTEAGWVQSVFGFVGNVMTAPGRGIDIATGEFARRRDQMLDQEARIRSDEDELVRLRREATAEDIQKLFDKTAEESPDLHQTYLKIAGMDYGLALSLFSADVENVPEAADQLAQLEDDIAEHLIQYMEEEEFGLSKALLDVIATWDRLIPMRLFTGTTLFLTDEDIQASVMSGRWGELQTEIEANDYSPAEALGLGGTGLGILLDFAGGMAFDPSTYFFGPKKPSGALLASREGVEQVLRSSVTRKTIDQAVEALATGDLAKARNLTGWLDDVGMADEFLDLGRQATTKAGEALGPHISVEASDRLRQLRETGIKASKGAEQGAEDVVRATFESLHARIRSQGPDRLPELNGPTPGSRPTPVTIQGKDFKAFRIWDDVDGGQAFGVVWADDAGTVAGGVRYTTNGTAEWYTAPWARGKETRLATRSIEAIHDSSSLGPQKAADALIHSASDPSMTAAGAKAVTREISNYIDNIAGGKGKAALAAIDREAAEEVVRKALLNGAQVPNANRLAVGVAITDRLRKAFSNGDDVSSLQRFISPHRTVTSFSLRGPGSYRRIHQAVDEIWGGNRVKANEWGDKLGEIQTKKTQLKKQMLEDPDWKLRETLQQELTLMKEQAFGDVTGARIADLVDDATPLADDMLELEKRIDDLRAQLTEKYKGVNDYNDVHKVLQDIWEDYNKEVIAKNKAWAKDVDPNTGMVPWEKLRIGSAKVDDKVAKMETKRSMFSESEVAHLKDLGFDPESTFRQLSGVAGTRMSANVPLSPLDMIAAGSASGSAYRKFVAQGVGRAVRETFWAANRAWVIDKVMRPSTALVVSFDELQRAFHVYGAEAVQAYTVQKMDRMAARASAILRARGVSVAQGADNLPANIQRRLKEMQEYPLRYRQAERQAYEGMGAGWDDIKPTDPGFEDAARRWNGQFLQDQGFRRFLEGEESFTAWWDSSAADVVRSNAPGVTAADAYQGWTNIWNLISDTARKNGALPDFQKAWKETAKQIDEASGAHRELPDHVYANMGTVRGTRKVAPNKFGLTNLQDKFFDKFFMEPTNYRRGFIHKMATEYETARLEKLYASQGKRILTDDEIASELFNLPSKGPELRLHYGSYLDDVAQEAGFVTRGRIEALAQERAIDEIDNIMYSWDAGSRAGRVSRGAFPFGGPWADMAGFWSRETLTRPHLRGWVNEGNWFGMGDIARKSVNALPINPRTGAFISRMANTDLEITEGWAGEGGGLLPGSERSDLSPLSFLPTKGDEAFGVLLPGIGYVPTFAADMLITQYLTDPQTDPEAYQQLIDKVGEFVPTMRYTTGPLNHDLIGGGVLGSLLGITADAVGASTGASTYTVTNFLGDIGREIDRTREVSALLANPGEIEDLLSLDDEELVELALIGIAEEADKNASTAHAKSKASRLIVPANSKFSTSLDQIQNVWVEAADKFPAELSVRPDLQNLDLTDPQNARQYANAVRSAFFDVDQATRDRLITQFPQLAVNLVSSWTWTDRAENELDHEATVPYRTDGTDEALARHQYYIDQGFIRPIPPYQRAERTLGLVIAARESTAKEVYEGTARQVNDALWEGQVSERTKALLQAVVDDYGSEIGLTDPRQVWTQWGSIEGEFEAWLVRETGLDPEKIKDGIKIPSKEKAWSSSWGGLDPEEVSQRFQGIKINDFSPEVIAAAEAAGIPLEAGMTGAEIHEGVARAITDLEGPAASFVMPGYNAYVRERGAGAAAAVTSLSAQAFNPDLDPEWRNSAQEFMRLADRMSDAGRAQPGGITRDQIDKVRTAYTQLQLQAVDIPLSFNDIWKQAYQRQYGPLDWEEPTPPTVFQEDGVTLNDNAYAPYIRQIVDGDTLIVSEKPGPGRFPFASATGDTLTHKVRLIGVRAADYGSDAEGAARDKKALLDAIQAGVREGKNIYLVRDPDQIGSNTDLYGRELAWLFIGDEPWYQSSGFLPTD